MHALCVCRIVSLPPRRMKAARRTAATRATAAAATRPRAALPLVSCTWARTTRFGSHVAASSILGAARRARTHGASSRSRTLSSTMLSQSHSLAHDRYGQARRDASELRRLRRPAPVGLHAVRAGGPPSTHRATTTKQTPPAGGHAQTATVAQEPVAALGMSLGPRSLRVAVLRVARAQQMCMQRRASIYRYSWPTEHCLVAAMMVRSHSFPPPASA